MASEKRLIDANAFLEHWNKEYRHMFPCDMYKVAIANFPTVDAVEVVHARWENGHCTNCKQYAEVQSIGFNCTGGIRIDYKETNYCPNCGAKMDGGKDNEDKN